MDRRTFLRTAAVVVGFDLVAREWVTTARAAGFDGVPPLDGQLLLDATSRAKFSTDKGNLVRRTPGAVLWPGSVADIATMITFCRERGIPVAARGQAHTTYGQGLVQGGLLIATEKLPPLLQVHDDHAVVSGGTLWRDVIRTAYAERRLTVPAITGYTALSIGGTLSVGGIGGIQGSQKAGLQVDNVRELEVVTGAGDVRVCSETVEPELFEAVLGGLGQCGVITRATLDLVPVKPRALAWLLHYVRLDDFLHDFRLLLERPEIDHVYAFWVPGKPLVIQMWVVVFRGALQLPNPTVLAGTRGVPLVHDLPYLAYAFLIDKLIDTLRATVRWDSQVKPWYDVWLPSSSLEPCLREVVPTLTHRDVGVGGFVLVFAQRREFLTRPFVRMPEDDGSDWVFLFDILTVQDPLIPDPDFAADMMARNNELFARARDVYGAVRYPIGSLDFTHADWVDHYGDVWGDFVAAKQQYDPEGILTPGPGIFG